MKTVLVVEDSETVRGLICAILSQSGYRVIETGDGQQAIAAFDREGDGIDLMVTDVVMPGMTGPELFVLLKDPFPAMRVLFVSGYTGDTVLEQEQFGSRAAFLQKPFSPDALIGAVRRILDA
jgi:two-component system cell cycle sensor histidine kinase/response regulator CckA